LSVQSEIKKVITVQHCCTNPFHCVMITLLQALVVSFDRKQLPIVILIFVTIELYLHYKST